MSTGRVCSIHNEWCADGRCRWCEPLNDGATLLPSLLIEWVNASNPFASPQFQSKALMCLAKCHGCGKSGEEIMALGETYKTHPCFQK